jgi:hypothetical protein
MLRHLLVLASLSCIAGIAHADDAVECDQSRDVCDAKVLELCPEGADVLGEREVPSSTPSVPRFRVTFRCRNAGAAELPLAPPAPAVETGPEPQPAVPAASPDDVELELVSIDARLVELEQERAQHSLTGPIVLLATGAGIAFPSLLIAVQAKAAAEASDSFDDFDEFGNESSDDTSSVARAFGAITVVGAALAVGGGVWLWKRVAARRVHAPEIQQLKARQRVIREGLSFGFGVDPARPSFVLSGRF